jgi:hypothetical protein
MIPTFYKRIYAADRRLRGTRGRIWKINKKRREGKKRKCDLEK